MCSGGGRYRSGVKNVALEPDYLGFYISFYICDVGQVIFIFHVKDDDNGPVSCWGNKRSSSWKAFTILLGNSHCSTHGKCCDYFRTK